MVAIENVGKRIEMWREVLATRLHFLWEPQLRTSGKESNCKSVKVNSSRGTRHAPQHKFDQKSGEHAAKRRDLTSSHDEVCISLGNTKGEKTFILLSESRDTVAGCGFAHGLVWTFYVIRVLEASLKLEKLLHHVKLREITRDASVCFQCQFKSITEKSIKRESYTLHESNLPDACVNTTEGRVACAFGSLSSCCTKQRLWRIFYIKYIPSRCLFGWLWQVRKATHNTHRALSSICACPWKNVIFARFAW